jgi:hypothetical protein
MPVAGRERVGANEAAVIGPTPPHSDDTKLAVQLAAGIVR